MLRVDRNRREQILAERPDLFSLTDHHRPHPWVLVDLEAVEPAELRPLLQEAWRMPAPRRLARTFN